MQLLLTATKRAPISRWICYSCSRKYATKKPGRTSNTGDFRLSKDSAFRTRFAPSPTGYLHLGSLRTALFNYLVAKATNGQFLLRIEDTDQRRTVPDAESRLMDDLRWAGIEWDEGPDKGGPYGPYKQSERTALYREHAEKLLENGKAYRCFCTPERLYKLAEHRSSIGEHGDYDRHCAHIPKDQSDARAAQGEAHVVRFKEPKVYPVLDDIVYGTVHRRIPGKEFAAESKKIWSRPQVDSFDDPVLLKTDGFPTYHLANVVDDHYMKISHVIRGTEWIPSTPKHLAMYEAFDWEPPKYAHVGLLLDKNKNKLSKRNASIDISYWRDQGIFPEALTNFLALLGWSHNTHNDVMDMKALINNVSMKYTRGDTVVTFEKLWYLQRKHATQYAANQSSLASRLSHYNPKTSLTNLAVKPMVKILESHPALAGQSTWYNNLSEEQQEDYVRSILLADIQQYTTPTEFIERNIYFFVPPSAATLRESPFSLRLHHIPQAVKHTVSPSAIETLLQPIHDMLEEEWNYTTLKDAISYAVESGVETSMPEDDPSAVLQYQSDIRQVLSKAWTKLIHTYLRWALLGGRNGPESSHILAILGKAETVKRLDLAYEVLVEHENAKGLIEEETEDRQISKKEIAEAEERKKLKDLAEKRRKAMGNDAYGLREEPA